ncbi:hypothetical protein B0H14DRAFT_2658231 [Mycena olivaceomarginata]|nr:hypothetical protein B0H14DRAFT_2658231 [Mycena olivaceomarginata]
MAIVPLINCCLLVPLQMIGRRRCIYQTSLLSLINCCLLVPLANEWSPEDIQHTPPPQNTQFATPPNADDVSNTDSLVTAADAAATLRILSEDKIRSIGRTSTLIGTKDGPIANQTGASLVSKAKVKFLSNKAWSLTTSDIEITSNANSGQSEDTWTKLTRSGSELVSRIVSSIPVWPEYAVSGHPVQWDTTIEIHDAVDRCWEAFASTLPDINKKETTNGPTSSMFLSGVTNMTTMDEGRVSEYEEKFKLLPFFGDSDLQYNRVPEVVVYNSITKKYSLISFHHIHHLGQGLVMNMTVVPMAISHSKQLSWDYCLVNITILGRREDDSLASPTKYVVKRKIINLTLDDSSKEEKQPSPKKMSAGKSSAGGKAGAAAA